MNRKAITKFLSDMLVAQRLNQPSVYWAREVTLDYGTDHEKRVDFVQFKPENQSVSGIEKGIFTCYEVKSCKEDFHSGNGLNFEAEKNYIVTTMQCYKDILSEVEYNIGIMVAMPPGRKEYDEFCNPTPLPEDYVGGWESWRFEIIKPAHQKARQRPMNQFLFYMLRSGH